MKSKIWPQQPRKWPLDLNDLGKGWVNFFKNYIFKISASSWEKWAIARLSSQTFTSTSFSNSLLQQGLEIHGLKECGPWRYTVFNWIPKHLRYTDFGQRPCRYTVFWKKTVHLQGFWTKSVYLKITVATQYKVYKDACLMTAWWQPDDIPFLFQTQPFLHRDNIIVVGRKMGS